MQRAKQDLAAHQRETEKAELAYLALRDQLDALRERQKAATPATGITISASQATSAQRYRQALARDEQLLLRKLNQHRQAWTHALDHINTLMRQLGEAEIARQLAERKGTETVARRTRQNEARQEEEAAESVVPAAPYRKRDR